MKMDFCNSMLSLARALLAVVFLGGLLFPGSAVSQESLNPLVHPGNRYARENTEVDILAHWPGAVEVQFLGLRNAVVQQSALSEVLALGVAARTDLSIHGFPVLIFDAKAASSLSRIIIFEFDADYEAEIQAGWDIAEPIGDISFAESGPQIASIFRAGLVQRDASRDGKYLA
jgi:hypothetical protein